jgi:hypothetical protein
MIIDNEWWFSAKKQEYNILVNIYNNQMRAPSKRNGIMTSHKKSYESMLAVVVVRRTPVFDNRFKLVFDRYDTVRIDIGHVSPVTGF